MPAKRYRKRQVEVEAVQWTGENREEVAAFLGLGAAADLRIDRGTILCGNNAYAHRDYIVRDEDGNFDAVTVQTFQATYEPVEGEGGCQKHGATDCEDCYVEALAPQPEGEVPAEAVMHARLLRERLKAKSLSAEEHEQLREELRAAAPFIAAEAVEEKDREKVELEIDRDIYRQRTMVAEPEVHRLRDLAMKHLARAEKAEHEVERVRQHETETAEVAMQRIEKVERERNQAIERVRERLRAEADRLEQPGGEGGVGRAIRLTKAQGIRTALATLDQKGDDRE